MQKSDKKLSPLEQRVLRTVAAHRMVSPGDHVLAGVSGGADSVAMLYVLYGLRERLQIRLSIAHMDHQIRGAEARREAAFVQELAGRLGLACIAEARDVPGHRAAGGLSLQEAARDVRYGFFRDAMAAAGANRLALGHQANDQAETVLMRLVRGASLAGLAGIPACRDGWIIRPLIDLERGEIEAWLRDRGLAFIADTSAGEQHYLRNNIRHRLLPLLGREYNPRIVATLARTASLLRQDERALDGLAAAMAGSHGRQRRDGQAVALAALEQAGPDMCGRIVRRIIAGLKGGSRGLTQKHMAAVIRLVENPGGPPRTVQLPGQWRVRRQYGELVFFRHAAEPPAFSYEYPGVPGQIHIAELGLSLRFETVSLEAGRGVAENPDAGCAYLDADKAVGPLTVRQWRPGDAFYPLGGPGRKKLQDLFCDLKIPQPERSRVPVLLLGGRIAWVCGLRLDERFRVPPGRSSALRVTMLPAARI